MENIDDYLKLEYEKLNNEILSSSEEIRTRERYVISFSPIVGAWIFIDLFRSGNEHNYILSILICAFTFLITFLFGMSVLIIYKNILVTAKYIENLEEHFLGAYSNRKFGWEKFYNDKNNNKKGLVKLAVANWLIYLFLPIIMAIVITIIQK